MSLEKLYNEYKKHTGDKAEYRAADFSGKLKDTFIKYGIDQYMSLITPDGKKPFDKDTKYQFEEEEIEKMGWFLGSATSRFTSGNKKYKCDEAEMNPFLHTKNRGSVGITDLERFARKYIEEGKMISGSDVGVACDKIIILINFAKELKKCIKRLIFAVFYMKNFNTTTFYKIIYRLNGLVDELYLWDELKKHSDSSYRDDHAKDIYRSIDVLAAADTCDYIYKSRTNNAEGYSNLVDFTDGKSLRTQIEEDYGNNIKDRIAYLYKRYVDLLFDGYEEIEISGMNTDKSGWISMSPSVEKMIFDEYGFEEGKKVYRGEITLEEAIENAYEWVRGMIEDAENKISEKSVEEAAIEEALDKLLFKPFIDFHNEDMERLKSRVKDNSKVLPKEIEKRPRSNENNSSK